MAKKKKKRFDVTKAVKAASRANIGTVPVTKRVPVKKKEPGEKEPDAAEPANVGGMRLEIEYDGEKQEIKSASSDDSGAKNSAS